MPVPVTPEIEADVLKIYRQNPKRFSPFKVANQVGCGMVDVLDIVNRNKDSMNNGNEHSGGQGREDLRRFFVASRRASSKGWENDEPSVALARQRFCDGTHTMATHRDGAWLFLCSIPLRWPSAPAPHYFLAGAV